MIVSIFDNNFFFNEIKYGWKLKEYCFPSIKGKSIKHLGIRGIKNFGNKLTFSYYGLIWGMGEWYCDLKDMRWDFTSLP